MRPKNGIFLLLFFLTGSLNGQTWNDPLPKFITAFDSLLVPLETYEFKQFFLDSVHVSSTLFYSDSAGVPVYIDTTSVWKLEYFYGTHFWGTNDQSAMYSDEEFLESKDPDPIFTGLEIMQAFTQDSLHAVDSLLYSPFNLYDMKSSTWYFSTTWDLLIVRMNIDNSVEPIYYDSKTYWYYFKKE